MQGKTIYGYTLQSQLGKGGMAEVWLAENEIGKLAAVKLLLPKFCNDEAVVTRFKNEAKVMVKLDHPNIRQVYDYGEIDGRPSIVMEYLEGDDLKALLKSGRRFLDSELRKWWNQITDALNYTHAQGIVHRDIKPSNIFLDKKGNIKLLDFGIAKIKEGISMTQTGAMMGTLIYMSPEQVDDAKHLGAASDVYSLAVSFVHLLTGKAPYDTTTMSDFKIREAIVYKPLDMTGVPKEWQTFLKPYLEKDPEKRAALRLIEAVKPINTIQVEEDEETINEGVSKPKHEPTELPKQEKKEVESASKKRGILWLGLGAVAALVLLLILLWPKKETPVPVPNEPTLSELDSIAFYGCQTVADYRSYVAEYGQDASHYAEAIDSIQRFVEDSTQRVQHVQDSLRQVQQQHSQNTLTGISIIGTANGHEYVDLGLPSGTLWATCNIGASKPEEYGDYYAWGETTTKNSYTWANYKYANGDYKKLTKYCNNSSYGNNGFTDDLTTLQSSDDPATANWGSGWHTPSKTQWDELLANTTHKWTKQNGKVGRLFTSKKNGQTIFLPAAGYYSNFGELDGAGYYGGYWSRSLYTRYPSYAWYLHFDSSHYGMANDGYRWFYASDDRGRGLPVRPVREKQGTQQQTTTNTPTSSNGTSTSSLGTTGSTNDHDWVDLGLPSGTLWATCNVGANKPEDYGDYYAWGETSTKSTYNWGTYKYANGNNDKFNELTKYCNRSGCGNNGFTDNLTTLQSGDDPATANWGSGWQTPSKAQWDELLNNTTNQWATQNDVEGKLFTSKKNGQTIFFPAAGYRYDSSEFRYAGSGGYYWSRSLYMDDPNFAWRLYFDSGSCHMSYYGGRDPGQSIRPVRSLR